MPFKIMRGGEVIRVEDYEIDAYLKTAIQNDFLRWRGHCHYEKISDEEAGELKTNIKNNLVNCVNEQEK